MTWASASKIFRPSRMDASLPVRRALVSGWWRGAPSVPRLEELQEPVERISQFVLAGGGRRQRGLPAVQGRVHARGQATPFGGEGHDDAAPVGGVREPAD